jgi:hypothetical protein
MLVSYTHSFIFFHVAKVGGISIRHALEPYTQEPERFKIKRPPQIINDKPNPLHAIWKSALIHATVAQTQSALPQEFDKFHKFAFVRNPWDWQVSMYHFLLQQKSNKNYDKICQFGSFKNYMEWVVLEEKPFPKGATKLQKTMLIGKEGTIAIDEIGRFETFSEDFNKIMAKFGIHATLPKLNNSKHKLYQDYYDSYTKKLVEKYFAEDIDLFKYTFN